MAIYDLIQNYNKLTIKAFKYINKNTVIIMNFMSQFTLFFIYIYICECVCVCVWLKWASEGNQFVVILRLLIDSLIFF